MSEPVPVPTRFWARVDRTGVCWLWTGGRTPNGYGMIATPGTPRMMAVHRLSWELHIGPIPTGLKVFHRCDVRACVNPDHLFLGSQGDNMKDMAAKGRARNGYMTGVARGGHFKRRNAGV